MYIPYVDFKEQVAMPSQGLYVKSHMGKNIPFLNPGLYYMLGCYK